MGQGVRILSIAGLPERRSSVCAIESRSRDGTLFVLCEIEPSRWRSTYAETEVDLFELLIERVRGDSVAWLEWESVCPVWASESEFQELRQAIQDRATQ